MKIYEIKTGVTAMSCNYRLTADEIVGEQNKAKTYRKLIAAYLSEKSSVLVWEDFPIDLEAMEKLITTPNKNKSTA